MEFSYTGQVYIPTITYMINAELSISYILMLFLQHYVCASVNPCSIVTFADKGTRRYKRQGFEIFSHNKNYCKHILYDNDCHHGYQNNSNNIKKGQFSALSFFNQLNTKNTVKDIFVYIYLAVICKRHK